MAADRCLTTIYLRYILSVSIRHSQSQNTQFRTMETPVPDRQAIVVHKNTKKRGCQTIHFSATCLFTSLPPFRCSLTLEMSYFCFPFWRHKIVPTEHDGCHYFTYHTHLLGARHAFSQQNLSGMSISSETVHFLTGTCCITTWPLSYCILVPEPENPTGKHVCCVYM